MKFAANLSMLFTEVPMMERFSAARSAGFEAVEIQYPYEWDRAQMKQELQKNKLNMVLFNLPCGDRAAGDVGLASDPMRREEFRAGLHKALEWASDLNVYNLNCVAGKKNKECTREEQINTLVDNLKYGAKVLGEKGIRLMIEPLNHYDVPEYLVTTSTEAISIIAKADMPNLFLQYDVYHAQREEGELAETLRRYLDKIGHIQIADNPGRHQPGTGEVNYPFLLREIERMGYTGFVALEYRPLSDTMTSLNWLREYDLTS